MNATEGPGSSPSGKRRAVTDTELQHIQDSLRGLRYGAVHIIVQDGVIVQIDRTEKHRLRQSGTQGHEGRP
jgi:hypothetical protein